MSFTYADVFIRNMYFVGRGIAAVGTSALNRENPGSNPLAAVSKLWQFRSSHVATVQSAV